MEHINRKRVRNALWKRDAGIFIGLSIMLGLEILCARILYDQSLAQFIVFITVNLIAFAFALRTLKRCSLVITKDSRKDNDAEDTEDDADKIKAKLQCAVDILKKDCDSDSFPDFYLLNKFMFDGSAMGGYILRHKFGAILVKKQMVIDLEVDELSAVLAHELAHFVDGDVIKTLPVLVMQMSFLIALPLIYIAGWIFGTSDYIPPVPVYGLMLGGFLAAVSIKNVLSLLIEYAADAKAAQLTDSHEYLKNGLEKLSAHKTSPEIEKRIEELREKGELELLNKITFCMNMIMSALFILVGMWHPSNEKRFAALDRLKA